MFDWPVTWSITYTGGETATLEVDGQRYPLHLYPTPPAVRFRDRPPLLREILIDGSDALNSETYDPSYIASIAASPYFQLQSWLREDSSRSEWRRLRLAVPGNPLPVAERRGRIDEEWIQLPPAYLLEFELAHVETPAWIEFGDEDHLTQRIEFARNNRQLRLFERDGAGNERVLESIFVPETPWPYLSNLLHLAARTVLAAGGFAGAGVGLGLLFSLVRRGLTWRSAGRAGKAVPSIRRGAARRTGLSPASPQSSVHSPRPGPRLEVLAAVLLLTGAALLAAYFARDVLRGEPHVYDASSLVFQAKVFASGHLAAPVPAERLSFNVPFTVALNNRWFSQYPFGAALALTPFIAAGAPWLAAPLFSAAGLVPIFLTARRLFGGPVAWLALGLGALAPFQILMSGSLLSHPLAMLCLAWSLYALVRFEATSRRHWLVLAWVTLGLAFLTRELTAVLFGLVPFGAVYLRLALRRKGLGGALRLAGVALVVLLAVYAGYNVLQTGLPFETPRAAYSAADRPGFGDGIGFYQRHTPAAGLVNTEQNLTALAIHLFGWPYPFALAVLVVPFLAGQAVRWDWIALGIAAAFVLGYITYFYHGIVYGPRYYYESLPALLLLAARGIAVTGALSARLARRLRLPADAARLGPLLPAAVFLGINLVYYLPRQASLYSAYTGLSGGQRLDTRALDQIRSRALVITEDWYLYIQVLAFRNCPWLNCEVLYAWAADGDQARRLQADFPDRRWLRAERVDGALTLTPN